MNTETAPLITENDSNPDPITGAPGSHPVATAAGAAAAGLAGAAMGMLGGPIGAGVGAVAGAIAGGLGGSALGEVFDPSSEEAHWRKQHGLQSYAESGHAYEKYIPGYRMGFYGFESHRDEKLTFEEAEPDLEREYLAKNPDFSWDFAREAARAAWERRRNIHEHNADAPMGVGEILIADEARAKEAAHREA